LKYIYINVKYFNHLLNKVILKTIDELEIRLIKIFLLIKIKFITLYNELIYKNIYKNIYIYNNKNQ